MSVVKLERGGYYVFGSSTGLKPVRTFVGKIDEPADLDNVVQEPVICMTLTSMREEMPVLGFAPFYLSALILEPAQKIPPFEIIETTFVQQYRRWRTHLNDEIDEIWDIPPAQVYRDAVQHLLTSGKNIRRPS